MRQDVEKFIQRHRRPEREVVERDLEPYRGRSLEELGEDISSLCATAAAILEASPDPAALCEPAPPHPSYASIVQRLRQGYCYRT